MLVEEYAATIDVRQFASAVKHRTIFGVWDALSCGARMLLVNDHDPKPLYYQLAAEYPEQLGWVYVENGPDQWQVEIQKLIQDGPDERAKKGDKIMARKIVVLDVREILRAKEEPFQRIMETVNALESEDVLELHATFQPDPLIRVLGKQGFAHAVVEEEAEHFIVQFYRETTRVPYFHLDNRELGPPQPMVRTLEFLDGHAACQSGELGVEIWNVRVPALLLPELQERNLAFDIDDEGNDTVRVKIYRDISEGV